MSEKGISSVKPFASSEAPSLSAGCLLIVDDTATNRGILRASFEALGYEVREAVNGEEALQNVAEGGIDLVLLDQMMPGMSGQDVLVRIRQTHSLERLPVIMVTALYDPASIVEAMKAGANDYVNKPFEPEVIQARVGAHLSRKFAAEDILKARDEAERAGQARSAYLSFISHELRTPITSILGYCQLLENEIRANKHDQYLENLGEVFNGSEYLLRLINDVLDLAKIEAGRLHIHPVEVALRGLIDSCISAVRPLMAKNGNVINVECDGAIDIIYVDDVRLRQVLYNLLGNAAKFTVHGRILLRVDRMVSEGKAWIRLVVEDNGIGIPEEMIGKLFGDFSQAHGRESDRNGTGLGLAISRRLCKLMGGYLMVESVEGEGSTFSVILPHTTA